MKQTEIYYRKISPGVIKITKIENALGYSEIRKQFGDDVTYEYKKGARYFIGYMPHIVLFIKKEPFDRQVTVDSVMTKQEFANIINVMKEAGERLRQIIKKHKTIREERIVQEANKEINLPIKKIEGNEDFFKIELNLNINEMIKIMPVPALNDLRKKITDEIATRNIKGKTGTRIFIGDVINDVNDINTIYENTPHEKIKEWVDNATLNIAKNQKTKEEVKTIKI